jgi:hypothetical protein
MGSQLLDRGWSFCLDGSRRWCVSPSNFLDMLIHSNTRFNFQSCKRSGLFLGLAFRFNPGKYDHLHSSTCWQNMVISVALPRRRLLLAVSGSWVCGYEKPRIRMSQKLPIMPE